MRYVKFPDGTVVRAAALADRLVQDDWRGFGLYMDDAWKPEWPADVITWPDLGLPEDPSRAAEQIREAFRRAQAGQHLEVGCRGGLGRTGTVLACMAVLAGIDPKQAVAWVREHYDSCAMETGKHEDWVLWFATDVRERAPKGEE
jgi:Swiss Army Knife protein, DSP-PTPase phosphatase domain